MVLSSVLVVAMDHWILNANIHARIWGKRTGSFILFGQRDIDSEKAASLLLSSSIADVVNILSILVLFCGGKVAFMPTDSL